MQTQIQDRPPFVQFEYRAIEDRGRSLAEGRYATKDVAFVKVQRPGSKDVFEAEADAWLKRLTEDARQGRAPDSWATGFRDMFEKWKRNEEVPVEGTPIKAWPLLSPAQAQNVIKAGFRTVEEFATAGDPEAQSVGIGAIDLREKARRWLEAASGPGKLVAEIEAMKIRMADQDRIIAEQGEELARLKPKG